MNGLADDSYKFGAGRFVMRRGLLEEIGGELRYYGESPYFVGGPTAMALARPRLQAGLAKAGMEGVFGVHAGQVCHEAARQKAQEARESRCDMVVAVGGGRAMDFGKLVAGELGTRVLCLPTSISTCAAYTPFSLLYTPDGRAIPGNYCYPLENAAILVDLDIMAAQPARYVIAGALDAMAKWLEIRNGSPALNKGSRPLAQMAGYWLAQFTFEGLRGQIDSALADLAARRASQALEEMIFLNIPLTGIVSALSRGVGQSALAHELYYQLRTLFPRETMGALHGEIVGLGLLPQLYYNGEAAQVEPFRAFLRAMGAPTCLSETGFPFSPAHYAQLYQKLESSNHVGRDAAAKRRFAEAMAQIAR